MELKKIHFENTSGESLAAADFLEQNYQAPKILIGHSLGGAAVLQAAAQKQRLLEIADRCPVHRTLHSEIKVETFLADRDAQCAWQTFGRWLAGVSNFSLALSK